MRPDYQKHQKTSIVEKEIVLAHSFLLKRVDGIVEIYYSGITYDTEHFIEIDANLKSLFTGEKLLILNYTSHNTSVTEKARYYLAQDSRADYIKAGAILIHSLAQKILSHFYLYVNKPKVNTNYFYYNEKNSAEEWLLNFKTSS